MVSGILHPGIIVDNAKPGHSVKNAKLIQGIIEDNACPGFALVQTKKRKEVKK
jgi:hypothetical protein